MNGNDNSSTDRRSEHVAGGSTSSRRNRSDAGGEGGYILVTLGLLIIPLMAFAALAVDVGSWYARTTEMQKAADSAALAGVIWAPDYSKAMTVAAKTLTDNGFPASAVTSQTSGNITITMVPGSAPNSFKVTITDAKAPVFFAKVFTNNSVSLTRSATALYYLPVPMGSPLAYFGGDASKYGLPVTTTTTGGPTGGFLFPPANTATRTYTSTFDSFPKGCKTSDPTNFPPNNWSYFSSTGVGRTTKPPGLPTPAPTCTWTATWVDTSTTTTAQPITYASPGFWANIMAPESDAANGDAHSPLCYGDHNCGSNVAEVNNSYRGSGYTYTITMPTTGLGTYQVQVFDAGMYPRVNAAGAPDQTIETGDNLNNNDFTTDYQMFNADGTPLDMTDNAPMSSGSCGASGTVTNTSTNAGHWQFKNGDAPTYENTWQTICTITPSAPGQVFLLRVKTNHNLDGSSWGDGSNRYALQVLGSAGSTNVTLSAYGDMEIYNNVSTGTANFYLARVGSQFAGKTLDIDLWDPGDAKGNATLTVIPPSGVAGTVSCTWLSEYGVGYNPPAAAPNSGGYGGTPKAPQTSGGTISPCSIKSTIGGTSQFNGDWLHIRVPIPATYGTAGYAGCGLNDTVALDCWWKINYNFDSSGNTDNTTWSARVEGDPIHLTQ